MDLVLIHGMGRTSLSMLRLRRRLRRAGHNPMLFGLPPGPHTLVWSGRARGSHFLLFCGE
jgi:hypothetical protein